MAAPARASRLAQEASLVRPTWRHLTLAAVLAVVPLASSAGLSASRPVSRNAALIDTPPLVLIDTALATQPACPTTVQNGHPVDCNGYVTDGTSQNDDQHCAGTNREVGQCMAARWGWTGQQWDCLDHRWGVVESGWSTTAGREWAAYGLPQSNPGYKMSGPNYVEVPGGGYQGDWRTDPRIQVAWGRKYIRDRYGAPCGTPWWGGY